MKGQRAKILGVVGCGNVLGPGWRLGQEAKINIRSARRRDDARAIEEGMQDLYDERQDEIEMLELEEAMADLYNERMMDHRSVSGSHHCEGGCGAWCGEGPAR
jgi:hypothetical protein